MPTGRWPSGDPNLVARKILAGPAYAHDATTNAPAPKSMLEIAWDWFVDHILHPIFSTIGHALGASKGVGTVLGFVLIVLALAGLAFVLFRLAIAIAPGLARRGMPDPSARSLDAPRAAEDWIAIARAAATQGDFRRAIAGLFAAALVVLDDRAVVPFDATRTPGEYRRLVRRARLDASAPFDELAERFVRAAYAEELPERTDFEAAERALHTFEPLVSA